LAGAGAAVEGRITLLAQEAAAAFSAAAIHVALVAVFDLVVARHATTDVPQNVTLVAHAIAVRDAFLARNAAAAGSAAVEIALVGVLRLVDARGG
jgi:hypothetical protein